MKKILVLFLAIIMVISMIGCKDMSGNDNAGVENSLPDYPEQKFELSGFWAPYDITEDAFKQYKDAGFTTLNMINHSLGKTSEEQFYLGSDRTMKSLELCRKLGLNAILNYSDWIAAESENNPDYYSSTPFSQYDIYGDYKDIITGIHIVDEPSKHHYDGRYNSAAMMEDFQKVYPNANYIVNLSPKHAGGEYWEFDDYDELVDTYENQIMKHLDNKFISVDFYPFAKEEHYSYPRYDDWVITYEIIAKLGKKYDAYKTAIVQSSVTNEFAKELSEADMRLQVNMALLFGFDHIQYYCYSIPKTFNEDGTVDDMYEHCILNSDNTPNEIYYWLKDIHKEIQSFSSVILAYDWNDVIATNAIGFGTNMDMSAIMRENSFEDTKHFEKAASTQDLVISRFTSEEYGEAYMIVNYAQKDISNTATVTFKDCDKVAVYGGKGFDGTPKITELDENGEYKVELPYGDGVFVVPIA